MGPHGPGSLDKDGDGQVSREEFAAPMNEHFGRIDTDGDGRLSTGELASGHDMAGDRNVMVWSGEGPDAAPGGERTMVFMGRHGGERMEHEIVVHGGPGAPHVIHAPGHDGPAGETRVEMRTLGGHGEHHGPGDMDKDGDGKVSEAEFVAPLRDTFARMDADRSGFIEEGEHGGDRDVRVFTRRIETRDED